ncbi:MAG: DUF4178 domain-containing protein [Bryobacterales bacterium]|nr:DUF4178 domain-containing protein [Bryobacterales bacterium]
MTQPRPMPKVRSLACPNCGGTVEVRGLGRTLTVVCIQCLSVLDATTPSLRVIEQFRAKERFRPLIPLGTRGKLDGVLYEAIGMQVREMTADGVAYHWSEYVLFNPYRGFRYLTEYNGHWNLVTVLQALPLATMRGTRPIANFRGATYRHFQDYQAATIYVMGEFPWRVHVGESVKCDDFIAPPRMLSREQTEGETVWSLGEYTPGAVIWKSFGLRGSPPSAAGVFANQPSPAAGRVVTAWKRFLVWVAILIFIQFTAMLFHAGTTVFSQRYSFTQQTAGTHENSFVTGVFELPGRICDVEVKVNTDLDNNWAYFNLALINADTSDAYDFSRQVSYYHGRDSDGVWTEGGSKASVVLPSIPPGRYYLRVEPEMDTTAARSAVNSMRYQIEVIRDVTTWPFFFIGAVLLLIPAIWITIRSGSFEQKRWAESDYSGGG